MTQRFSGRMPIDMIERELEREKRIVNAETRVEVYGELLREALRQIEADNVDKYACDLCMAHQPEEWPAVSAHSAVCIIRRINRVLAADADEIARLLAEWAQGRGA